MRIGAVRAWTLLAAFLAAAPEVAKAGEAGRGFELSVIVDGRAAPEYFFDGRVYVEARRGREFTLRLRNPSAERIAVALSVDGRNVIDAKRTSAGGAAKWVLGPGETVEIPGWQVSGQTARRFFFTETSRSYAKWLGDISNTGLIEAVFFRERSRPVVQVAPSDRERRDVLDGRSQPRAREPRAAEESHAEGAAGGIPGAGARTDAPPRDAQLRRKSAAPTVRPPESDELAATGIGERMDFRVRAVDFDADPVPAARLRIRYEFRSELVRLGVLPREGDPSWRDRSRGFEPDYAPDPYRTDRRER